MRDIRKLGSTAFQGLLWCAAIAVLVQNLILSRQNARLKAGLLPDEISTGRHLVNLGGSALDGTFQSIDLPPDRAAPLVIVTFSPGCRFCQATEPTWAELSREVKQRGERMIWVSRDQIEPTREYCEKMQIPLSDVLADPPHRTFSQLSLEAVPNTIIVGAGGAVEKVWSGSLDAGTLPTIRAYLQSNLR